MSEVDVAALRDPLSREEVAEIAAQVYRAGRFVAEHTDATTVALLDTLAARDTEIAALRERLARRDAVISAARACFDEDGLVPLEDGAGYRYYSLSPAGQKGFISAIATPPLQALGAALDALGETSE